MIKNVFVGNRYVPKFDGIWDKNKSYESLVIVMYEGNSYISKKNVPSGTILKNNEYWVQCSSYNGQLEEYKDKVDNIVKNFNDTVNQNTINKLSSNSFINAKQYGCDCEGNDDSTLLFKEMIEKYNTIFIPDNARIKITQVNLKDNIKIIGGANSSIIKENSNSHNFFFIGNNCNNVIIENIKFEREEISDSICYVVGGQNMHNISLNNNECTNCGLIATYHADDYNLADEEICSNITLKNNNISNNFNIDSSTIAIMLRYVNNFYISNNNISNVLHGVMLWGGDSDFSKNGAIENERKCKNGIVVNNNISNVLGGGLWGSMMYHVKLNNNLVDTCYDVGLDFEGSYECEAKLNTVINCRNGCCTTFFINRDIIISDNTFIQQGLSMINVNADTLYRNYNSSLSGQGVINIILKNNNFYYYGDRIGHVNGDSVNYLDIINNNLYNTLIDFNSYFQNQGQKNILNNKLLFDKDITKSYNAINLYDCYTTNNSITLKGGAYIINNYIEIVGNDLNNTNPCIFVHSYNHNVNIPNIIKDNTIINFGKSIGVIGSNDTDAKPSFLIINNIVSGEIKAQRTDENIPICIKNNYDHLANEVTGEILLITE